MGFSSSAHEPSVCEFCIKQRSPEAFQHGECGAPLLETGGSSFSVVLKWVGVMKEFHQLSRRRLVQLAAFAPVALLSPQGLAQGEIPLRIQGSTTVHSRLLGPHQAAIEELSGQKLVVVPNKSIAGIIALLEGKADLAMISSPLQNEITNLQQQQPDAKVDGLRSFEISRTRVAFAVNASNPVRKLNNEQLKALLLGKIASWKELGGSDIPVRLVMVRQGGGTSTTVASQLLGGQLPDGPNVIKVTNGSQILKVVEQEPGAIGIAQLSLLQKTKLPELASEKPIEQQLNLVSKDEPNAAMKAVIDAARKVAARNAD
jgi:phosphate transport system substrate-binding protein